MGWVRGGGARRRDPTHSEREVVAVASASSERAARHADELGIRVPTATIVR